MATMMNRGTDSERGQAIIELALTLPLLLLIVLGVFDFGLMFQRYEVVTNAAREGARVAVLPEYTDLHQSEVHAATYLASGGLTATPVNTAGCTGAVTPGRICVSTQTSTDTIPATPSFTVDVMNVTVTYDHEHVFVGPIMGLFGGSLGTTRLTAVSRMRKE